jgi:MFS transporter, DHA2 family, methylenomycin A resistance protein
MAMLDVTEVKVALGAIRGDLNPSMPALFWIVEAYTLTFAALLLAVSQPAPVGPFGPSWRRW